MNLRQFNPTVTGNVNRTPGGGVGVQVSLLRADAGGNADHGRQGIDHDRRQRQLVGVAGPHAPGDDRDEIDVVYSGGGAPSPSHQVIQTGNGGDPFTEAGWTGWFAMDAGSTATSSSLTLAPCFQTGRAVGAR